MNSRVFRLPALAGTAALLLALAASASDAPAPANKATAPATAPAAAKNAPVATKAAPAAAKKAPSATSGAPAPVAAPAQAAPAPSPAPVPPEVEDARRVAESVGLVIKDLKVGTGDVALPGAVVRVHYTGWLYDPKAPEGKGQKFDSSLDRGDPFMFALGAGKVIRGWDLGVAGMQPGGKRRLVIPPDLGYGERGAGGVIPPNATLTFDVELLNVRTIR
jgi:FKBP-type peptidyl-prolyl cis-trans isomerase FkpA